MLLQCNVINVATASLAGKPSISLKSVVGVDREEGLIFFMDLYDGVTGSNLRENPEICISVFDVGKLVGYRFVGVAEIHTSGELFDRMFSSWQEKRRRMISGRIQENIRRGYSPGRSEASFPEPRKLISIKVKKVDNF